jgi:hypothetical protein
VVPLRFLQRFIYNTLNSFTGEEIQSTLGIPAIEINITDIIMISYTRHGSGKEFIRYAQKQIFERKTIKTSLGAGIKGLNRIAKCGCDHSCLKEESLS